MKNAAKFIVTRTLGFFAGAVLHRYEPQIVMVTGSVGKTSTKDAVAAVLATRFFLRKSEKSFNTELGVPFTILGVENPWANPIAWLKVLNKIVGLLLLPNHYPKMLVLEVGSDRPGDLAHILKMATPDMVVVTRLPEIPVHVESYSSPTAVQEEEFSPALALAESAPLIIPIDDEFAVENAVRTSARVITYGPTSGATVLVSDAGFAESDGKVTGMRAQVAVGVERGSLEVPGSIGATQLLPAAAAVAAGVAFGMPLAEAIKGLKNYEPPPGRGRLLAGVNGSLLIDDSYNSSPAAVEQALETLRSFPRAKRRIAILGDMLELGRYSVMEHERIALIAHDSADVIAAVGIRSRAFAGVPKSAEVLLYDNSRTAAAALKNYVQEGDVVLIKGSQSLRMEYITAALLADPADVSKLVRQEKAWKQKR